MRHRIIDSFTGPFVIIQEDNGELSTSWLNAETRVALAESRLDAKLEPALARKLTSYFQGKVVDFSDIPLPVASDFYLRCWRACRRIARGKTVTYGELAELAGSTPAAARAAGQAMRHNRLPIVIPCHRVIGTAGKLHGFGGSRNANGAELAIKSALLMMEGARHDQQSSRSRTTPMNRPRTRTATVARRPRETVIA